MSAAFDSLTLRTVALELTGSILGAQVQKIRQPDAFTVLMRLHGRGVSRWLLLCTHPNLFRAHLTTRDFENPPEPPPFCMALRKYLEGGRVIDVRQEGADRVLCIEIASTWGRLCLVAELMGRHSNVILLSEGSSVLEAMKHVGGKMSHRIVLPGHPYPALPPIGKTSLWDAPENELAGIWSAAPKPSTAEWLMASFGGMSPALAERVTAADDPRAALDGIVAIIRRGEAPPFVLDGKATISEALDETFGDRAVGDRRGALLRGINAALDREDRALQRRRGDLKRIEDNAERVDEWRIAGELLLANLHAVPTGASGVSLPNYYDPELAPLEITLDPALGPRENAEAFFQRHRKGRAAFDRLPHMAAELDRLEANVRARRMQSITADEAALEALRNSVGAPGRPAGRTGKQESLYPPGVRIKRFVSGEGYQIWIGENATGNDYLTTKASDPGDIWLHVRAAASAHGVIRTNKHPEKVPPATLRRAAELVAARSEAKGSGVIPVDYTLRRYVRKPRGAAPGRVTYTNEKTIEVLGT